MILSGGFLFWSFTVAKQSSSDSRNAMANTQMMKGVFAGVVILVSIAFVVWAVWPTPPIVIPPADNPAAQWVRSYGAFSAEHSKKQDALYWATSRISTEPTPDNQGVIIKGKVSTAADLNLLKAELAKLEPAVALQWQVTIGQ